MKDSLDLRFNRGGSEGEVGSTKSVCLHSPLALCRILYIFEHYSLILCK